MTGLPQVFASQENNLGFTSQYLEKLKMNNLKYLSKITNEFIEELSGPQRLMTLKDY